MANEGLHIEQGLSPRGTPQPLTRGKQRHMAANGMHWHALALPGVPCVTALEDAPIPHGHVGATVGSYLYRCTRAHDVHPHPRPHLEPYGLPGLRSFPTVLEDSSGSGLWWGAASGWRGRAWLERFRASPSGVRPRRYCSNHVLSCDVTRILVWLPQERALRACVALVADVFGPAKLGGRREQSKSVARLVRLTHGNILSRLR